MDTKLLHEKIERFTKQVNEGKLNIPFAKEMILDINTWILGVEQYVSEVEVDLAELGIQCNNQRIEIETLKNSILVLADGKALVASLLLDKQDFDIAVEFLLKCGDRENRGNIYVIAKLLGLAKAEGKDIKDMVQLVNYARTGV